MKAREHKRMTQQREYEKQQKDRTSRNSYKRTKFMVTKRHMRSLQNKKELKNFIV